MRITKTFALAMAMAGALALSATTASATIAYDQNLTSPGGWFDGSGNPNGGFTVFSNANYTFALRIKLRQDPNVIHSSDGVYHVPAGQQPGAPGKAAWNYEFDFACNSTTCADGSLQTLLTNSYIKVEDLTTGDSGQVSLATWVDSSTWGSSGKSNHADLTSYIAQNSQNPMFSEFPLHLTYSENAEDAYRFTLIGKDANGDILGQVSAIALVGNAKVPAPEPVTLSLVGAGLAGMGFMAKRRKKTAS